MPYLNSVLFYQATHGTDLALVPMVPTALAAAAAQGRIDAGPVPLLDALALRDRFEPLDGYCIATTQAARSILLFSSVPIDQLDGRTVGVTGETSTSARLLRLVLAHRYDAWPARYVGLEEPADAVLLIGDGALKARGGLPGRSHIYDLGSEWHALTGLPTVFALWVVRHDLPGADKAMLAEVLRRGLDRGIDGLPESSEGRSDLGMTGAEVREYLEGFSFRVGGPERHAIEKFARLVSLLPERKEATRAGND